MINPKVLREQNELVKASLEKRGASTDMLESWIEKDWAYRGLLQKTEQLKATRNQMVPKGKPDPELLAKLKEMSNNIKEADEKIKVLEDELNKLVLLIPNLINESTPIGKDEEDNVEIKTWGIIPSFSFPAKSHDVLGIDLKILNFEQGAKISGSRFTVYKGFGAKLERALINFMLDTHSNNGYEEILPPFLVNSDSLVGTGQLPKFEEDLYKCSEDDLYLIPTAEVPVTNLFKNEIIPEAELPKYFVAYTPCFRREAGSYGKDTAGLIRQHQFNKVELVTYSLPENSEQLLEELTSEAELILEKLELPYRRVQLCSGDIGFSSSKTYDLEVWFPSQNKYREISSCSNFLDFQARRAKIRYRSEDKKVEPIHTLNGSGLAVGRTVAAILENYQQEDGSIKVPNVLQDYLKIEIIKNN